MLLRAKGRRPDMQAVQIDDLLPRFGADGHWTEEFRSSLAADMYLEISEIRVLLRRCISEVPESDRVVLMLRDIDELDTQEVAALLGLTTSTIKVRLHRARQALKSMIERSNLRLLHNIPPNRTIAVLVHERELYFDFAPRRISDDTEGYCAVQRNRSQLAASDRS
jgi:Sigma-70, region 4